MFSLHFLTTSTRAGQQAADLLVLGMPIAAAGEACEAGKPAGVAGVVGVAKRWQRAARHQARSMKPAVAGERGTKRGPKRNQLPGTSNGRGMALDITGALFSSVIASDPSTEIFVCRGIRISVSSRPFNGPQADEPPPRAGS